MDQKGIVAVGGSVRLQFLSGIAGFLILAWFGQAIHAVAFAYGTVLMVLNGFWLAHRLEKIRVMDAKSGQVSLYAGAVVRFVALIIGLLFAHQLGLHLLFVAAGIFVAQVSLFAFAFVESQRT